MKYEIITARCDDWCAIYVNGTLMTEGHHFNARDLWSYLEKLGDTRISDVSYKEKWVDYGWIEEKMYFPQGIEDVVWG